MRAMILAAGLGTRLRPLTDTKPKALVEVGGRPMLEFTLDLFTKYGVREVVMNIHHHADQMREFTTRAKSRWPIEICLQDESAQLLGSGGGIGLARDWLYETESSALFWNPDGLVFPDLKKMFEAHRKNAKNGDLATINVVSPMPDQKFHPVYCQGDRVLGFGRQADAEVARSADALHFIGGYILEKEAASMLPGPGTVCDIAKEVWFPLAKAGKFAAYRCSGKYQELGNPEEVKRGTERLAAGEFDSYLP